MLVGFFHTMQRTENIFITLATWLW